MPHLQVLILIVDIPHNPSMVGTTLDAKAIGDQSTTNTPTVEILDAYTSDHFYKTEEKEKFQGRYRWRWTDAVSRKIQHDGSYEIEDSIVFDFACYDPKKPLTRIFDWKDSSDVDNMVTKQYLRQRIDSTISSFDEELDTFNNDPTNNDSEDMFRLEILGTKSLDKTANSRVAMARNLNGLETMYIFLFGHNDTGGRSRRCRWTDPWDK
jgi:hypothetical protein